jgi:hypothetical protein
VSVPLVCVTETAVRAWVKKADIEDDTPATSADEATAATIEPLPSPPCPTLHSPRQESVPPYSATFARAEAGNIGQLAYIRESLVLDRVGAAAAEPLKPMYGY